MSWVFVKYARCLACTGQEVLTRENEMLAPARRPAVVRPMVWARRIGSGVCKSAIFVYCPACRLNYLFCACCLCCSIRVDN